MKYGVSLPQNREMQDPVAARDFAQAIEGLGYEFLIAPDHVLGAEPTGRSPGSRINYMYNIKTFVHEPLILFAYLGAVTSKLQFSTEIIILPQRQTVLFAKQAAQLDYLTGGRLRVGLGIGWNTVEYESLNEDFSNRGRRLSEQIEVLRALWTQSVVDFEGRWHRIDRAGLNPMPVQRPIPIWLGGHAEPVLRRTATLADGWLPMFDPAADASKQAVERLRQLTREAGRKESDVAIEARMDLAEATPADWAHQLKAWVELGATYAGIRSTARLSQKEHLARLVEFKEVAESIAPTRDV